MMTNSDTALQNSNGSSDLSDGSPNRGAGSQDEGAIQLNLTPVPNSLNLNPLEVSCLGSDA